MLQFFYLLLAWSLIRGLHETGMLVLGRADTPGYPGAWFTLLGLVAVLAVVWAFGQILAAWQARLAQRDRWRVHDLLSVFWTAAQLGLFVLCLTHLRWGDLLLRINLFGQSLLHVPLLGDLLALLPAVLIAIAAIHARYRSDRALRPGLFRTAGSHAAFNLRWLLVPLALLLVISLVSDLRIIAEHESVWMQKALFISPTIDLLLLFPPMLIALAVFPIMLRLVLPLKKLPDADVEAHLRGLSARMGAEVSRIYLWDTGGARVPNAMVTGLTRRTRVVLMSDAILEDFSPAERDAVFCHELGHVKHHHLLRYLLAVIGMVMLLQSVIMPLLVGSLVQQGMTPDHIETVAGVLGLVLVLTMIGFMLTFVSRINERQADLAGSRFGPHPLAIAGALERINAISGGKVRTRPSPTHGSIASRVDFLMANAIDQSVGDRAERRARFWHRVVLLLSLAGVFSMAWPFGTELADANIRGQVFDILHQVDGSSERELEPTMHRALTELIELSRTHPHPVVSFYTALLAEELVPWQLQPDNRATLLEFARRQYQLSLEGARPHVIDPLAPLRGLQRVNAMLRNVDEMPEDDAPENGTN